MRKTEILISKLATIIIIILMFSQCGPSDVLVPLNKVEIPEYEDQDYINLLKSDNPELVYNAIVILFQRQLNMVRPYRRIQ